MSKCFRSLQGSDIASDKYGRVVNKDGSFGIKAATITIYQVCINIEIQTGSGSELEGLSTIQAIGTIATHENVHSSDKSEINKDLRYEVANPNSKSSRPSKEDKPNQAQQKIISEQKRKINYEQDLYNICYSGCVRWKCSRPK